MTDNDIEALVDAMKFIAREGGVPDHYIMPTISAKQLNLMDCVSHAVTDEGDFIPIENCLDPGGVVAVSTALMAKKRREQK